MPKKFDYGKEAGELGSEHVGTSKTGRFWGGQGAGILLVAKDTGRVLLALRSTEVNEPNTWGVPGGEIEPGENPAKAARREAAEELGVGRLKLIPAYVFEAEDFKYYNFIGIVPSEFEPILNWETQRVEWFDVDDLPSPLHFGVKRLFANSGDLIRSLAKPVQELLRACIKSILISD